MHKDLLLSTTNAYKFKFSLLGLILLFFAFILLFMHLNLFSSFESNPVGNMLVVLVSIFFVLSSVFTFAQGYYRNIQLQKDKIIEKRGFLLPKVIDRKRIDHVTMHTSFVNSDTSESDSKILQIFDKNNNLIEKLDIDPYSNSDIKHLIKLLNI